MGRPLNKKYFGNRNVGSASTIADDKIGGEGVASVTVGGTNNSTGYTTGDAVTFSAPQLPGGVTATGTIVATAGVIDSITITEAGSGYTSAPTVTASTGTIGTTTLTAVLTTEQTVNGNQYASQSGAQNVASYDENAILIFAKTTSGGTSQVGDILAQKGRSSFLIKTADGTARCTLKSSAVSAAGECTITATDSASGTYFVTKISAHRCTVVPGTGTQFTSGQSVPWTFGNASNGVSVKIPNA